MSVVLPVDVPPAALLPLSGVVTVVSSFLPSSGVVIVVSSFLPSSGVVIVPSSFLLSSGVVFVPSSFLLSSGFVFVPSSDFTEASAYASAYVENLSVANVILPLSTSAWLAVAITSALL